MPSNRAVLRDIADLGLDPTVAHRHTKANGRIPAPAAPVAEEPLKLALKKLPEKKVEAPKAEEAVVEEPKKVEAPVVEVKPEAKVEKPAKKEKAPKAVPAAEPAPVAAEADDAKKA